MNDMNINKCNFDVSKDLPYVLLNILNSLIKVKSIVTKCTHLICIDLFPPNRSLALFIECSLRNIAFLIFLKRFIYLFNFERLF